jgi:hypothetical protein
MKKVRLFMLVVFGISHLFQSCKSELNDVQADPTIESNEINALREKYSSNTVDETIKGDFVIREGIVHFKDINSFLKVKDIITSLKMEERVAFFNNQGFISRLSITQQIIDKIRNAKTVEERDRIIQKNSNILLVDGDKTVLSKLTDDGTSAVVTNDGMVYIGKILYMFTDGIEYIVYDGDKTRLEDIKNGRKTVESAELSIINTANNNSKNGRFCRYMSGFTKSTAVGSDVWGKTFFLLDTPTFLYQGSNLYTVEVHAYSKGVAVKPDQYGTPNQEFASWNTLSINFAVNMYPKNQSTASSFYNNNSAPFNASKTKFELGTDFHNYARAYNQPAYRVNNVDAVMDDNTYVAAPQIAYTNRYNNEFLGPNQWITPYSCN